MWAFTNLKGINKPKKLFKINMKSNKSVYSTSTQEEKRNVQLQNKSIWLSSSIKGSTATTDWTAVGSLDKNVQMSV